MNNMMVHEIQRAKRKPKSSLKIRVCKIHGGANYASKYSTVYKFKLSQVLSPHRIQYPSDTFQEIKDKKQTKKITLSFAFEPQNCS
jgi:hypothetical protein